MSFPNIKAMVSLLDDTDNEVVQIVENQIKELGNVAVELLEKEWEQNGLNPVIQKKIENLVHQIQFQKLEKEILSWKNDGAYDLLTGLWLIAKYQYPDLEIDPLRKEIIKIKNEIWVRTQEKMHPADMVKVINHVLFDEQGFESNTKNFHSSSNSMFNLVLSQKKGNPVALCSLYILLAEKLDLPIYGVNLPNLFVLIFDYPGYKFYINAFNRGQIFVEKDIDEYLKQIKIEPEPKYYKACSNQDIVVRILTNLSFAFHKNGEKENQAEIDRLLEIFRD